jgi:FHA domain
MLTDQNESGKFIWRRLLPKRAVRRIGRVWRVAWDSLFEILDRRFDHLEHEFGSLTTDLRALRRLIDEASVEGKIGWLAPHHLKIHIDYSTYAQARPKAVCALEAAVTAAAIDHINDRLYHTLLPIDVETVPDVFASGITVEPSFGELANQIERNVLVNLRQSEMKKIRANGIARQQFYSARISIDGNVNETELPLKPGLSLSVGRAGDNALTLKHPSVSLVHAAVALHSDGSLVVSDVGSEKGTFVNGQRVLPGQTRVVRDRSIVTFGRVKVRFKANIIDRGRLPN